MPEFTGDYGLIIGEDNQIQIDSTHRVLPVCHFGKLFMPGTPVPPGMYNYWGPLPSFEESDWPYGNRPDYLPDRAWAGFPQASESIPCTDIKAMAIRPNSTRYSAFKPRRGVYHPNMGASSWAVPYEDGGFLDACIISEGPYDIVHTDPYLYYDHPEPVEYVAYSYDPYDNPPKRYGLEIYNGDGDVVFNSGVNFLKIKEVKLVDISNSYYYIYGGENWITIGFTPVTVTHDTMNPYYLMTICGELLQGSQKVYSNSLWVRNYFTLGIKKISSTSCSIGWIRYYYGGSNSVSPYPNFAMHPSHISLAMCTL